MSRIDNLRETLGGAGHCPRSFMFAGLWDTDTIEANRSRALKDLRLASS